MYACGQAMGRIKDKPHVEDLVKTIVLEAAEVRERFAQMY
jgi:hypothetical protein